MAPQKKYATEEERKAARREVTRRYRELNREKIRQREREKRGVSSSNEELADEDRVEEIPSAAEFIQLQMSNIQSHARYQEFTSLLAEHGIEDADVIDKIYKAATTAHSATNTRKGFEFEKAIQKLLLNQLRDSDLYLYRQVPFNDCKCMIDFVITKEKAMKDRLDLSKAVVVSTKTGYGSTWREDMHLYDKCKRYFMVTLTQKIPTESLPDNVYFASPNFATLSEHVINLDSLKDLIIKAFEETS